MSGDNISISNSNQGYLELMRDIFEVSKNCSAKTYIWGGLAIDIFEGRFIREHGDLDGFIENMIAVLEKLIYEYKSRGYDTEFRNDINMLIVKKGDIHAAFNPIEFDSKVAMWRHIGDYGTVYFPLRWLDSSPRVFYNVQVYTSGVCFEYGFRQIVNDLNPEWKEREKDRVAKVYLESKITEEGLLENDIMKNIWSYNPFWIEKGYDPFDKPVLVCPRKSE